MATMDEPNIVKANLRVKVSAAFYDDEASQETLRYCVEQALEDAGFDVDVRVWNPKRAVEPIMQRRGKWVPLTGMAPPEYHGHKICSVCESMAPHDPIRVGREILSKYCPGCGAKMESVAIDN